jgi:hypothetical protein
MGTSSPIAPIASNRRRKVLTILRKSTGYVLLLLLADLIGVALPSIVLYRNLFHYFTLVVLIEAGLLFLIGGAADFGGSLTYRRLADHGRGSGKKWSFTNYTQKQESVAAYVVAAVILLLVSFVLAYPLN